MIHDTASTTSDEVLLEYTYSVQLVLRVTTAQDVDVSPVVEEYQAAIYRALSESTDELISKKKIVACDALGKWIKVEEIEL